MRLLLVKCAICDHWHKPFRMHCPNCGAMPLKIAPRKVRYFCLNQMRLIEIVRGVPALRTNARTELMIARELAD